MVIDHAGRLHEGVTGRGSNETKPQLFQGFAHSCRRLGPGGQVSQCRPRILDGTSVYELPEKAGKTPMRLLNFEDATGVIERRLDLPTVPDDAGVLQKPIYGRLPHPCYGLGIEVLKGPTVPFPLVEDRAPRQAGLGALQGQTLK